MPMCDSVTFSVLDSNVTLSVGSFGDQQAIVFRPISNPSHTYSAAGYYLLPFRNRLLIPRLHLLYAQS